MRLIFLGAPGAGKGTQAQQVCNELRIAHISTGDILREAVAKKTPVGLKAKSYMEKGELVPDSVVINIVSDRLKEPDCKKGFLLDGFPRTEEQAKELDKKLLEMNLKIDGVICFSVTEEVVIKRISGRRLCSVCGENYHLQNMPPKKQGVCDKCGGSLYQRKDDNEETIRKRLEVFEKQSKPLVNYYKNKGCFKDIVADGGVQEVYQELISFLKIKK